ncbi:MAG: hypothetical protein K0Q64_1989, partial [Nitrobacter vulgaris]|nr:hypothetical protein [Nitrobacter vulgaris]
MSRDGFHQYLAQARMFDAFDCLADEGLDQQCLGLLLRDATRLQIEKKILIECACG